jgi:hypothetical protein
MTNAQDVRGKPPSRVATTGVLASRRTDYEMEIAREAQARFLPRKFPHLKTLSHAGICVPVGGDFSPFILRCNKTIKHLESKGCVLELKERWDGSIADRSHVESQTGP